LRAGIEPPQNIACGYIHTEERMFGKIAREEDITI